MITPCETCSRDIADGATFCAACAHRLDAAIADITAYRGLAYDLDLALSRQTSMGDGTTTAGPPHAEPQEKVPGTLRPMPSPYDARASTAAAHLRGVLASWTLLIVQETGATVPPDQTLTGLATWLRPRVGWLRHHPAGAEAHGEILDAVNTARRVVDRPADRLYAGPCDECGAGLYATPGALIVECRPCELAYEVTARRDWLLASLDDYLANATQTSRLVTYLGIRLAPNSIRMYASKGRIVPHGKDEKGHPMYRFGDVVRTYYSPGQKAS